METTTFIIIVAIIVAVVFIAKILKELFEFLIKLMTGLVVGGVFFLFIFFAGKAPFSGGNNSFDTSPSLIEEVDSEALLFLEESLERELKKGGVQKVNFSSASGGNVGRKKNIVEDRHYHYSEDHLFEQLNISNIKRRDRKPKVQRPVATNIPRVDPIENTSTDCIGKAIPTGYYIIVEGVYTLQENAEQQVAFLKKNGFLRAGLFRSSCYNSIISAGYFVVTLDRNCRTQKSAQSKKKKAIEKFKRKKINCGSSRIIQIMEGPSQKP